MDTPPAPPEAQPPAPVSFRRTNGGRVGAALAALTVLLVLGLWGTTVAGRLLRAPPALLAIAVTLLPYLYLLAMGWAFVLWSALPDRRSVPLVLGALFVSGGALWAPGWPARVEVAAGEPIRVMTWNVRRLWGAPDDGGDPLACVVAAVQEAEPDLLALLEVSAVDVDALSEALGLDCVHTDYRGVGVERFGGLAACARGGRWALHAGEPQPYRDSEQWRYVFTEMNRGGRVVNLLAVHLHAYYPDLSRSSVRSGVRDLAHGEPRALIGAGRIGEEVVRAQGAQTTALLDRVARFRDPTLVVGDFNSVPDAALHTALRRELTDTWLRGGVGFGATAHLGGWLPLRIDYVYATDAFAVRGARVPAAGCSDHRPVVADLVLREAQ